MPCTLHKEERLRGKKSIDNLLSGGNWGNEGCLKYCVVPNECGFARIIVSVPKKKFKRAVKRNLLKRRIREAYRQQKPEGSVDILFVYNCDEVVSFDCIYEAVGAICSKVSANQ